MDIQQLIDAIGMILIFVGYGLKKAVAWYKNNKNKKTKPQIEDNIKKLEKIYEKIVECRLEFGACRVSINQFHNGEFYYSNNSILKMSMTHESTDDSTKKISEDYQNVLASRYHKFISDLVNKDVIYYNDIEHTQIETDEMVIDLKINGTTDFYCCKLKNHTGHIVGFLAMSFCGKPEQDIDMEDFKEYAELISFIIRN